MSDPKLWRALSTLALVVGIVGLILGEPFGWYALILSGVTFAVELVLSRLGRARPHRP